MRPHWQAGPPLLRSCHLKCVAVRFETYEVCIVAGCLNPRADSYRELANPLERQRFLSLHWSDTLNWDSGVPDSTLMAYFDELYPAYTNGVKLVNNIVDVNFVVGGLTYDAFAVTNTFDGTPSRFYTTLIPDGVGLGVAGINGMPSVRVGFDFASYNNGTVVATIMGPGSLFVTNPASTISISEGSSPSGTHKATLDLSGVGSLTASESTVLIGVSPTFDDALAQAKAAREDFKAETFLLVGPFCVVQFLSEVFDAGEFVGIIG